MNLSDDYHIGKTIDELVEGQKMSVTQTMEDRDILLYLGITNDSNPLFIQRDYAKQTIYKEPLVPSILIVGIMTATISKHIPGPGSRVVNIDANFIQEVHHGDTLTFDFEVSRIDRTKDLATISIVATNEDKKRMVDAVLLVEPPLFSKKGTGDN